MKLLQLGFTRTDDGTGRYNCNLLLQNTNYTQYYYGTAKAPTCTYDVLIHMLQFVTGTDCVGNHPPSRRKGSSVKLNFGQLAVIVQKFFTIANSARALITIDDSNERRVVITIYNNDHDEVLPHQSFITWSYNVDMLMERIVNLQFTDPFEGPYGTAMKSPNGKKLPVCRTCGTPHGTLEEVPTSMGDKVMMCKECKSVKTCGECKFQEPAGIIRSALKIRDDNGKNDKYLICLKCAEKTRQCKHCGQHYNNKEYYTCPCQIRNDFKQHIKVHNDDVLKYFDMDMGSNELFGIEIEAGTANKNRKLFADIAEATTQIVGGDAILKYDSSIDFINKQEGIDNEFKGFEIVTRPMMYKNAARFLKNFCKNKHPMLKSWEVGTCGLHIHVSKACLRPIEVGKILLFINDKNNRKFIKMIAKREDKRFAKFIPKRILDYRNNNPECHYEAINTSKPHTIEFRVFRGTLNVQTLLSYLQFVKSVVDFVRVASQRNLSYEDYIKFLDSTEKSQFRELKERITKESMKEINDRGEI